MLNIIVIIKAIWLLLFNLISIDNDSLREDARKIGLGLATAGILGFVVQTDKVTSSESTLLFGVGIMIWVLALLKPTESDSLSNTEDSKSE